MFKFIPAAFARLTAFLLSAPCCSLTRRFAFCKARFSSLALYIEDVLAIVPLFHKRHAEPAKQGATFFVSASRSNYGNIHAPRPIHFVEVDLGGYRVSVR